MRLAILVVASVVLFAGRPTAEAKPVAPADGYGFSVGALQIWMSPEDADREMDAAAKTHARWMRVHIDWHAIEKVQGQFDWGYVDHWVDGARQRGMKVLGLIVNTPEWAEAPGTALYGPPINAADFGTFAATVVTRYRDRVSDWEIWNEPNLPRFLGFAERQAAVCTGLLKAAHPVIKSVQPDTCDRRRVESRGRHRRATELPHDMYLNGAKGYFDAIGMHPYVFPGGIAADPSNGWSDLARAHDVMTLNGDGDKKVWLTEFGAPTSAPSAEGVSQEEQAKEIIDLLAGAAATGWSGPAFIYSIRDIDSADPDDREDNFGALMTTDWQPKYAASVLAR